MDLTYTLDYVVNIIYKMYWLDIFHMTNLNMLVEMMPLSIKYVYNL